MYFISLEKQEAYRGAAEVSIYLKPDFTGKGMGSKALDFLELRARENQVNTLIAGVCSENSSSLKLFLRNDFEQCAHFRKVGFKFGRWLDTIYLQKHF